jgi:hypothetical protein
VHFHALADLQELDAEAGGFKTRTSAHFVEILIIFEKKFLGFAAGAQRAAAPVFNRHHDNRRPEAAFPDRPLDNPCCEPTVPTSEIIVSPSPDRLLLAFCRLLHG